jgi:CRP-like cAMP-binding protein
MIGIPLTLETDTEDVAWALQTADALWKRNERVDAIVWLRRAAQAAGDAEDDDRALALARGAAELAEWVAQSPQDATPLSLPPAVEAATSGEAVDAFLRNAAAAAPSGDELEVDLGEPETVPLPLPVSQREPSSPPERVPSAAEVHAGMLDPWADGSRRAPPLVHEAPPPPPRAKATFDPDEVVTSAPPVQRAAPPTPPARPPPARPPSPPPAPPPPPRIHAPAPAGLTLPAEAPTLTWPRAPSRPPSAMPKHGVDLSHVEAFGDLPDDAREAFADAATVQELVRDEEVAGFALALVVEGTVDLAATIVDSSALTVHAGAVLRSRGTIEQAAPVRLVALSERATVATWDERAVDEAFRTCPWVEDELRSAGDRLQALVGATMGALGDRLDPTLRADVTSKLSVRALAEHEVFAMRGQPIPGLLVVGAGELELVGEDGAPNGTVLRAGEFLFPNEVIGAAPAPATVRASTGGALILLAERKLAQELLVTCPPLLEIFAGF